MGRKKCNSKQLQLGVGNCNVSLFQDTEQVTGAATSGATKEHRVTIFVVCSERVVLPVLMKIKYRDVASLCEALQFLQIKAIFSYWNK